MAYFISRTMCSTPVVYLSLVGGPPGLCTLALLLNHKLSCSLLQRADTFLCVSAALPAHRMVSSTDMYMCSVLKDGRAFLDTLALDSNCIVWCTCCGVFTLCALKLHIHPVDDCSFPFFFSFSFPFPVLALYGVYFV